MIEMVSKNHAIVKEGTYKKIKFTICFLRGGYYTCYLDVTKTSLYSVDYKDIDLPVYWGLTYSDYKYPWEKDKDFNKYIIGWDYAHFDDALEYDMCKLIFGDGYFEHRFMGHNHHTIRELTLECIKAIDSIYEKEMNIYETM